MNTCPVCEAPALARVCEVCGHAFGVAGTPEVQVSPMEDLEAPISTAGPAPVVQLSDLEPTRFPAAANPTDRSEVDWERTVVDGVPDVAAGGFAELESGREETQVERTVPTAGPVTCRYCRHVQASGALCDDCGMRLPWVLPVASPAASFLDPDALVRCRRCGERTYQRERCSSCGGLLAISV